MVQPIAFKSGRDLGEEARVAPTDTVTCGVCGTTETDEAAYDAGWQMEPPVCSDCLRWAVTMIGECCTRVSS